MSARAWWTAADQAELDVVVWELVNRVSEHAARCPRCRALAARCPAREEIVRAQEEYDLAPLDAPPGFFQRLREHDAVCERCQVARADICLATSKAIEVVLDWRRGRRLLSRAAYLRRKEAA